MKRWSRSGGRVVTGRVADLEAAVGQPESTDEVMGRTFDDVVARCSVGDHLGELAEVVDAGPVPVRAAGPSGGPVCELTHRDADDHHEDAGEDVRGSVDPERSIGTGVQRVEPQGGHDGGRRSGDPSAHDPRGHDDEREQQRHVGQPDAVPERAEHQCGSECRDGTEGSDETIGFTFHAPVVRR